MARNFRALGLALVAVFALSAVAAQAALGQGKLTSDGPVTLVGTQTGGTGANAFTVVGVKTECANAIYTGHQVVTTPHQFISSGTSSLTITPHYGICISQNLPSTIDMNGCDYVFHLGSTTGNGGYAINFTIVCPSGNHITKTIFTSAHNHTTNKPFCHITITENAAGYAGLEAKNTTGGHIGIIGTASNIMAHKKSPTGSILCPEEATNTASLHMDLTVTGRNSVTQDTSISLSH